MTHTEPLRGGGACALAVALIVAWGCSARVVAIPPGDGGADARGNRPPVRSDAGDARADVPYFDTNAYDIVRTDPCPGPRPPAVRAYECDPFNPRACSGGASCYPYVEYPTTRCGAETYRARCIQSGSAPIGSFCTSGNDCPGGASCFVTGAMNRCLQLCRLDGSSPQCPRGRVCEPTDLPDFGACN